MIDFKPILVSMALGLIDLIRNNCMSIIIVKVAESQIRGERLHVNNENSTSNRSLSKLQNVTDPADISVFSSFNILQLRSLLRFCSGNTYLSRRRRHRPPCLKIQSPLHPVDFNWSLFQTTLYPFNNCECCPVSRFIVRSQRLSWIQVLNCQHCNQCQGHKSLGVSLSLSLSKIERIVKTVTKIKNC